MKPMQFLRNHPLLLAVIVVIAFGSWLVYDGLPPPATPPDGASPLRVAEVSLRVLPEDPLAGTRLRDPSRPGVVTADLITRLHPGMTRVDVEELIGLPPAGLVQPVSSVDGKLIYRASYLANLEPRRDSVPAGASPSPRSIIALEYDAGRPGHPLVKVHIPDPMS